MAAVNKPLAIGAHGAVKMDLRCVLPKASFHQIFCPFDRNIIHMVNLLADLVIAGAVCFAGLPIIISGKSKPSGRRHQIGLRDDCSEIVQHCCGCRRSVIALAHHHPTHKI